MKARDASASKMGGLVDIWVLSWSNIASISRKSKLKTHPFWQGKASLIHGHTYPLNNSDKKIHVFKIFFCIYMEIEKLFRWYFLRNWFSVFAFWKQSQQSLTPKIYNTTRQKDKTTQQQHRIVSLNDIGNSELIDTN